MKMPVLNISKEYVETLMNSNSSFILNGTWFTNTTTDDSQLHPLTLVIPITVVYAIIFVTGLIGNVSTCIVIACNKCMHTATNYYLFSLAISDLLLLISGLPPEMYRIWSPENYVFGEAFCVLQGFAAETSANATVLTITAFTVERYVAICHPFLSHTMSKLSRAIKYIIAIWIIALCLAAPQAIQFGIKDEVKNGIHYSRCTVVTTKFFEHAFEISTFLFFVGPMTLITVLYILIAIRLRKSRVMSSLKRTSVHNGGNGDSCDSRISRNAAAQNRVIKMLVAVVVAFFLCWAPFHAQRLLAVYLSNASQEAQETSIYIYMILVHASGVLYFLSTTINPVLYNIMSNKFRNAFKTTLSQICHRNDGRPMGRSYSVLSRCQPSIKNYPQSLLEGFQQHNQDLQQKHHVKENKELPNYVDKNNTVKNEIVYKAETKMENQTQMTVLSNFGLTKEKVKNEKIRTPRRVNWQYKAHSKRRKSVNIKHNERYLGGLKQKMFNIFNKTTTTISNNDANIFLRQGSVGSANTISNSSLQDTEEMEFSNSDLVKYMEQVNEDLT